MTRCTLGVVGEQLPGHQDVMLAVNVSANQYKCNTFSGGIRTRNVTAPSYFMLISGFLYQAEAEEEEEAV